MQDSATALAALLGGGMFLAIAIGGFAYLLTLPWALWSGVRSLRRQAQALERLADATEHANRGGRDEFRDLELARRTRT